MEIYLIHTRVGIKNEIIVAGAAILGSLIDKFELSDAECCLIEMEAVFREI